MNVGKKFEADIVKSIPEECYIRRLRDIIMYKRVTNEADFLFYDFPRLYLLELKTTKEKSLPFSNIDEEQLKKLNVFRNTYGVIAGFMINYRAVNETYYVPVGLVYDYFYKAERRSIPIDWCKDKGVQIEQKLKRTRYSYNIRKFMEEMGMFYANK